MQSSGLQGRLLRLPDLEFSAGCRVSRVASLGHQDPQIESAEYKTSPIEVVILPLLILSQKHDVELACEIVAIR